MKIVDDFLQTERSNLNWLERLFMNYPEFYFAKDIEITRKEDDLKPILVIRPSILRRLIASGFIIMGLIAWLIFLNMVLQNILFPIALVFLLLISIWTGYIIWNFFLNPKYSYKIYIDKKTFRAAKLFITWDAISEVMVMVKGGGRHRVSTLVIFGKDNSIHRFSLQNIGISNDKLLGTIELYRQKTNTYNTFEISRV